MSELKKMPNERSMRTLRHLIFISIAITIAVSVYFKKFGGPVAQSLSPTFTAILILVIGVGIFVTHYYTSYQRCPDCGKRMREVYEDVHTRAEDFHVLYCKPCDTIWDTIIPKSHD